MIGLRCHAVRALVVSSLAAAAPLAAQNRPEQAAPAPAQQQPAGQGTAPQPRPAGRPAIGQASSQMELDDFNKLRNENDSAAKKRLIDEFFEKYPGSGLEAFVHQEAAYAAKQANDFAKLAEHGEKSLEILPDNYVLMTELGNAYAERNVVDKAEARAEQALELVGTAPRPPQVTEEQWALGKKMLIGTNYSTLGYVHLRRAQATQNAAERKSETEKAIAPFKKALEQQPNDDVSLWRLGIACYFLNDYSNAETNLAKAVAVNGIAAVNARGLLEDLYKRQHKDSLEGLDRVLAKAKRELGLP